MLFAHGPSDPRGPGGKVGQSNTALQGWTDKGHSSACADMSQVLPLSTEVVDAIGRCAQVLDEPDRLKEEVAQLRSLEGEPASFATALFELERARRGDPEARQALSTIAEHLLGFWQDRRGDSLASQHPALELLWADASALLISFEVKRFARALESCWEARGDAERLALAIDALLPEGNRRVEFARCLYHLELARLGRAQSRAEFARRAVLIQEAYGEPRVAQELIGEDSGLDHLWKELVPYLDEFFEMLEEQQAKAMAAAASPPMPAVTAPAPPPAAPVTERVPAAERTTEAEGVPAAQVATPAAGVAPAEAVTEGEGQPLPEVTAPPPPTPKEVSREEVALHRAPVSDATVLDTLPPDQRPTERPQKADELLPAHLEEPEEAWVVPSDQRPTDRPQPAVPAPRDNVVTDQVPALAPPKPPEEALDSTLPPRREMGNVSGVFDLWLTTQEGAEAKAEPADEIEVVEPEPTAPPARPPRPPDESGEIELADVVETIPPGVPPPPPDTTPVPVPPPKRRVTGSGIIDLQQALKDSKAQAFARPPPPPEPEYQPDAAALAFWRYAEQALQLLPPGDGPRLEARVLSGEGRAERKKLTTFADEALRRFEGVPESRAFACMMRLYLAAQMKEKSLFGGVNAKRKEAFRAALQLLSGEPLAAGHVAVWFELDGKQTVDLLQSALEVVGDYLQFCSRSGLDPLDASSAEQFLP